MGLLAGMMAALVSYLLNRWTLKNLGDVGIFTVVPLVEEVAKSGGALFFGASIITTHFIFGCIEGIYDIINSSDKIAKWAALASIISHSLFGASVYFVMKKGYSLYWGILLAWLFHSGWNWYITKYM